MTILKSFDDVREYLIRTSCTKRNDNETHSHVWNSQNGLLASEARYKEIIEDDQAESLLTDEGHMVGSSKAFNVFDDLSLVVSEDGKVTLSYEEKVLWSREESLASVAAVEIVRLPIDMRDRFGLKKMIVLVTENGKLFGMDTLTGDVIWELFDKDFSSQRQDSQALLVLTKQSDEDASQSRALVVHPRGFILRLNPVTGQLLEKKKLSSSIKQIAHTEIGDHDSSRGVIILDTQNSVHVYPECLHDRVKENIYKYYLTTVEHSPPRLEGYKFAVESNKIVPKLIWNFNINDNEKIVSLNIKRIDEEVHSPARVLGDRGILYKYLNPNLIAVMTQGNSNGDACNPDHFTSIYLVDGVTGALVHSITHPKTRAPANMVHSENWLVYSYYNTKSRRTEVSSLEMFEGTTQSNSSAFSSLTRSSIKPKLIEHKSFIFPAGIDAMIDTVTLRGMTNRHIIVALPSGALLEIPKIFLDPRRPINMLAEHREEGLIPYMPELPIPSESIINYDQTLLAVRKITTSPAMLESTSLVFAYGLDFFFTRVTPSKTFDILKDDFDHLLITGVLIFLVVASYVSKLLAQRKALHAAWK
ncbi:Hypothetical predicted protein [Olea europaea subsp. europaea]|uniref:ER membrane protein complex subunit 1 n=1 Tax=Olea europaea subsp. europaea TaxID=158383 RepID=A0A8S0QBK6_OLEEU|nr:Hypothetical predicted protein [Olea europaea subsp. europaea]